MKIARRTGKAITAAAAAAVLLLTGAAWATGLDEIHIEKGQP